MSKESIDSHVRIHFERAVLILESAFTPNARSEAKRLLDFAQERVGLSPLQATEQEAVDRTLRSFDEMIHRRALGEPIERIVAIADFCGKEFVVVPDVIIPRIESEILVDLAVLMTPQNGRVLDLGTGTGALLISILLSRSDAFGVGLDVSDAAVGVAKINAAKHGVSDRCAFETADWFQPFASFELADLIVANPPYISTTELSSLAREIKEYDPVQTLCGGEDGLESYRAILGQVSRVLKPNGWIGFELGWRPIDTVCTLMIEHGLKDIQVHQKHHGYSRAAFGRLPPL